MRYFYVEASFSHSKPPPLGSSRFLGGFVHDPIWLLNILIWILRANIFLRTCFRHEWWMYLLESQLLRYIFFLSFSHSLTDDQIFHRYSLKFLLDVSKLLVGPPRRRRRRPEEGQRIVVEAETLTPNHNCRYVRSWCLRLFLALLLREDTKLDTLGAGCN